MNGGNVNTPAAMVAAHPGHELRLFRWLEIARPTVFVLTDGSGSGSARTASSRTLIHASGSTAGVIFGEMTDVAVYEAILSGDAAPIAAVTNRLADAFVSLGVRSVVADPFEFYNPTHDLCAVVAAFAAARAEAVTAAPIARYDYALTGAATGRGEVVELDAQDVERKLAAAFQFENLTRDVEDLMRRIHREDVAREIIRPVSGNVELRDPGEKPFYETRGEERVAAGHYQKVLRYEEHFVPFVRSLAQALNLEPLVGEFAKAAPS